MNRHTFYCLLFLVCSLFVVPYSVLAENDDFVNLNLTDEQIEKLEAVSAAYEARAARIEDRIDEAEDAMVLNLVKRDRFDSSPLNRIRASRFNMLLRRLGNLYGQMAKAKIEFFIEARNILSKKQMGLLLDSVLGFTEELFDFEEDEIIGIDLTDPSLGIDLTIAQERSLLDYYALRDIQRIRLILAVEHQLLDMAELVMAGKRISVAADERINDIGDIAVRVIENEVEAFIVTKEILTVDQKKDLAQLLLADD